MAHTFTACPEQIMHNKSTLKIAPVYVQNTKRGDASSMRNARGETHGIPKTPPGGGGGGGGG